MAPHPDAHGSGPSHGGEHPQGDRHSLKGSGLDLTVKFAVYGALPGGDADNAQAIDVTHKLQNLINNNGGIVACNDKNFGDPSSGNLKHFGALVLRNGAQTFFACEENQTIDFNRGGGGFLVGDNPSPRGNLAVKFAVYGALPGGDRSNCQASDVTRDLQKLLNDKGGQVVCNNESFPPDPAFGNAKHFAAVVNRNGRDFAFACAEGQTINFENGGS